MLTPLAKRLSQYEEKPPEAAWQYIASELKEDKENVSLADKLLEYEVPPPPDSWTNIAAELHAGNQTNRNTGKMLPFVVLRLSAAAADGAKMIREY